MTTGTATHFAPLYATYGYYKDSECRKYVCHGRTLDCNQKEVFSDNAQKIWWYIEFISRHEDDLPWKSALTYNVPIRKRWRRRFYLSERQLAGRLCLTRTTVRKHLANFRTKGFIVVISEARYAPSMHLQRRATTYAIGPNFHSIPEIQRSDGADGHELFSSIQRVGHNCVNSKDTEQKHSKAKEEHTESKTQLLEKNDVPKKLETIEAIIESNGKPLPLSSQFLSDLQIENLNSKNLPRHLSPQYTIPSRLKTKYLQKLARTQETPLARKERLNAAHARGVALFEAVLRNVGKPGEVGREASEGCPKGIPYHPGYAKYKGQVPLDIQNLMVYASLNDGLTRYRVPRFNLPQMRVTDARRPKCPHKINNDRSKGRCKRTMRLALHVEDGTCYWQCPSCSKHTGPVSLNYAYSWDRRDGLGNWLERYPFIDKLARTVSLKLEQIRHQLTADRQDEIEEAVYAKDASILQKFFDIHIRGDKEWMDILHRFGDVEREDA